MSLRQRRASANATSTVPAEIAAHEEHLVRDLRHAEGEVDEQRGRDRGHRRPQAEQREREQDSGEDEQGRELEPVVRVDRVVEPRELRRAKPACSPTASRRDVVVGCPGSVGRRDVDDRDETRDVRRRRGRAGRGSHARSPRRGRAVVRGRRRPRRQLDDDAHLAVREDVRACSSLISGLPVGTPPSRAFTSAPRTSSASARRWFVVGP